MLCLKPAIVLHQLIKANRLIAVEVRTGIQHIFPASDQRPEIHACVGVDLLPML